MKMIKKGAIQESLLLIAGGAAANKVANINLPIIPEKVRPFAPVLLGIVLMSGKNKQLQTIGAGMVAAAGPKAINAVVPSLGIGSEAMSDFVIEGMDAQYALNGPTAEGMNAAGSYALAGTSDVVNPDMFG